MPEHTPTPVGNLLKKYAKSKNKLYADVSERAGLDDQTFEKIVEGETKDPSFGTLIKIADALGLSQAHRDELEAAAGHEAHAGFLRKCEAGLLDGQDGISMRRAVLLLTAYQDPSDLPTDVVKRPHIKGTLYARTSTRRGVVFGVHDTVIRATTPVGLSVLDYSQMLFREGQLRTVETIPLRDDMPCYVDTAFSCKHLSRKDYVWANIFVQGLGGDPALEFPKIFQDVERMNFHGGVHLLTAAITIGQYDSVVEVLAANIDVLQDYVRSCQDSALDQGREAHTVTYVSMRVKSQEFGEF